MNFRKLGIFIVLISIITGCKNNFNESHNENKIIYCCHLHIQEKSKIPCDSCNKFLFIYLNKQIFQIDNPDYALLIYYIEQFDKQNAIYDIYDSPTGRRKIIKFDLKFKKIYLSDWFDNSGLGDKIDTLSIINNKIDFNVLTKANSDSIKYKVKFISTVDF